MNRYRVEIIETRRYLIELTTSTSREAVATALAGQGEITQPNPPEIEAIQVTELSEGEQ